MTCFSVLIIAEWASLILHDESGFINKGEIFVNLRVRREIRKNVATIQVWALNWARFLSAHYNFRCSRTFLHTFSWPWRSFKSRVEFIELLNAMLNLMILSFQRIEDTKQTIYNESRMKFTHKITPVDKLPADAKTHNPTTSSQHSSV